MKTDLFKTHERFIMDTYDGLVLGKYCLVTDSIRNVRRTARELMAKNYVREVDCVRVTRTPTGRKATRRHTTGFVLTDTGLEIARELAAAE